MAIVIDCTYNRAENAMDERDGIYLYLSDVPRNLTVN